MRISVIIVTYNSSQFVIETLDSIIAQNWQEIELIITDDCSADNTVDICKAWIDRKADRFVNTLVLESEENTGISANANRGLAAAHGEWIVFLAGDDTLCPECISDNMQFVTENPETKVLFSQVNVYQNEFKEETLLRTTPEEIGSDSIVWPERTADSQYRMLLISDRIHFSPSVFLHRKTLLSVGGFDERFRLLEDYPLWLNLTRNGHKLYFMDKITVNYRMHSQAVNNTGYDFIVNPNYFIQEKFRKIYTYPNLPNDVWLYQRYNWYISQIFRLNFFNRNTRFNKLLYSAATNHMNIFKYFLRIRILVERNLKDNEFYMR